MSKKSDGNAIAFLLMAAIGLLIAAGSALSVIGKAVYKIIQNYRTKKPAQAQPPVESGEEKAARIKHNAEEFHAQNLLIIQQREQQTQREYFLKKHREKEQRQAEPKKVKERVHTVDTEDGYLAIEWRRQFDEIKKAWGEGDYDFARTWLQKMAYAITNENTPAEVHEKFKKLMVAFTKDDPLYADVMRAALPVIAANPGIVQSALSKQLPQFDIEQFRYAMYYGAEIGDVVREKKGRSYALRLPEPT